MSISSKKIKLGVSACLLGEKVRFDGSHKRSTFVTDKLSKYVDYQPICPEMAIGMGVPRPTIRLVQDKGEVYLRGTPAKDGTPSDLDVTDSMIDFSERQVTQLDHLSGYILKSKSPSCGMERVKVYDAEGKYIDQTKLDETSGLYARALMKANPLLPVEEEGRLNDPVLRENFLERVYAYARWQQLIEEGLTPHKLVDFHTRHKLMLMARKDIYYRELGQIVAQAGKGNIQEIGRQYIELFMHYMKEKATPKSHSNVLMHIMGYLKRSITSLDKQALLTQIHQYRRGEIPLIVPVSILNDYFRRHPKEYMAKQYYLEPFPADLGIRNRV